jgi:hypothetical protein
VGPALAAEFLALTLEISEQTGGLVNDPTAKASLCQGTKVALNVIGRGKPRASQEVSDADEERNRTGPRRNGADVS